MGPHCPAARGWDPAASVYRSPPHLPNRCLLPNPPFLGGATVPWLGRSYLRSCPPLLTPACHLRLKKRPGTAFALAMELFRMLGFRRLADTGTASPLGDRLVLPALLLFRWRSRTEERPFKGMPPIAREFSHAQTERGYTTASCTTTVWRWRRWRTSPACRRLPARRCRSAPAELSAALFPAPRS